MLLRPALFLCVMISPLLAQKGDRPGEAQPPPPPHIKTPPAPALSPAEELKTFTVAPGFRLELIAAEPLVFEPVAMAFGPDGRLWVVEMRGFMPNIEGAGESEPVGSVSVLEDTDGDGRMDKRTEFLKGLVMPRAIGLVGDGVLIAEPPHLWFARDKNGDGVADEKIEVANDYGAQVNPEHTANGLMWALDNWIYSANHTVRFRYAGDGKFTRDLTITRGQWGISQDDRGRIYYNSNSDPLRADLLASGYLKRNPNATPAGSAVQLVPARLKVWPGRVTPGINRGYQSLDPEGKMSAVTAACGPVVYRGGLFPADFRGNVFVCEPSGNLIKRIVLEEADGTVKGRNAYEGTEFLTSTDERFRPVNLLNGPDGALYVADLYRGVLQHRTYVTTYLATQVKERGLETPIGKGRIWRIVPETAPAANFQVALARATNAELVRQLASDHGWTRDTAQRLLVERGLDATPAAASGPVTPVVREFALATENSLGRLHAFWTLEGLNAVDPSLVLRALGDADPRVAAAGLRLAEKFLTPTLHNEIFARVLALGKSAEPTVRLQVALTLGAVGAAADGALRALVIAHPTQPFLADAVISGIGGREGAFVQALVSEHQDAANAPAAMVALATSAALKGGNSDQMQRTLAPAGEPAAPAWARAAVLDGVQRFLPKSPDGKTLVGSLPFEPKPLLALAGMKETPDGQRATKLVESLKWPGKPGMKTTTVTALTPAQKALFEKGQAQFALVCAACHQPNGQGLAGLAPPLVNSRWALGDERILARIVLSGKVQENMVMPPMKTFDDETLAGIFTFIRRSWGHEADPVSPAVVKEARAAIAGRDVPLTDADLVELVKAFSAAKPAAN